MVEVDEMVVVVAAAAVVVVAQPLLLLWYDQAAPAQCQDEEDTSYTDGTKFP